jgi:outer membrane protein assembly factor BamA
LRPRVAPGDPEHDGRGFGFSEYRMTGTYRERHAFRSDSDLLISLTSEQAVRTTFNYARQVTSAELLHRLNPQVSISGRYALEFTRLFDERIPPDEQPVIDRLFPQIRLSMLSAGVSWDRRDNPLVPTRGTLASADAELAAEAIGSQVGYIKGFFQLSGFRALDSRARSVLALRAQLGVARGFRDPVPIIGPDGAPLTSANGQPLTEVDVPISQRFFAGGGTTVRGFQLDRLGAPEILNPDGLSLGGNAVTVFNAELRRVVATLLRRNLALVGFVDAGNVFARASDVEFGRLRGATGFGVRYDSPLGPLRLDFGFKKSREVIGDRRERGWEYHLSIGEAF